MEFYWINDTYLRVNGEEMLPEQAYEKYPEYANIIQDFVESSKRHDEKISTFINSNVYDGYQVNSNEKYSVQDCCLKIKNKIKEIFSILGIDSNSLQNQKYNAYALFEYIIKNSKYDDRIMEEKAVEESNMFAQEVIDIYKCLCENRSVCTSDASALSLLFRCAGIDSQHLTIAEKGASEQGHEVVKFVIDDNTFICDPTLVRTSLEQGYIPEITPDVFAFSPNEFFEIIYPSKEVVYEYTPLSL